MGKLGLFPDADDFPGDIYFTSDAFCTDGSFAFTTLDFTVHGAMPDSGKSSVLIISICKIPDASALDAD